MNFLLWCVWDGEGEGSYHLKNKELKPFGSSVEPRGKSGGKSKAQSAEWRLEGPAGHPSGFNFVYRVS